MDTGVRVSQLLLTSNTDNFAKKVMCELLQSQLKKYTHSSERNTDQGSNDNKNLHV